MPNNNTSDEAHKARATIFQWSAIVIIVLSILIFMWLTGIPPEEIKVGPDGVAVKFGVKPVDQRSAPTVFSTDYMRSDQSESGFVMNVPGENPMPLNSVDAIIIEPGPDDFQNRHLKLVRKALDAMDLSMKYEEQDVDGVFATWLTNISVRDDRSLITYQTRLKQKDGKILLAMREAYKESDIWQTQISEDLRTMMQVATKPNAKSVPAILNALEKAKPELITGKMNPGTLINLCFVDGQVTMELLERLKKDEKVLGDHIGLSDTSAIAVANFGYQLYLDGEYAGSQTFWQAMVTLLPEPYFYTMLGVCNEKLGDTDGAILNYKNALILDPQYKLALSNLERFKK